MSGIINIEDFAITNNAIWPSDSSATLHPDILRNIKIGDKTTGDLIWMNLNHVRMLTEAKDTQQK